MREKDTNSIRYPRKTDIKLEKLATTLRRSKKELFCQMVDYFHRSKKDPDDPGDEMLKRELSSGISRILSFIRQQEKDFMLPMLTDHEALKTASLGNRKLLEGIVKHLSQEGKKTETIIQQGGQAINGLKYLSSKQKEKEFLKEQFSEILEYYITQREEMNWTTSAVKKEELIAYVRKSLKKL